MRPNFENLDPNCIVFLARSSKSFCPTWFRPTSSRPAPNARRLNISFVRIGLVQAELGAKMWPKMAKNEYRAII